MMAKKIWQVKEFTSELKAIGFSLTREAINREAMNFVNKEGFASDDWKISWHTEPTGKFEDDAIELVAQVYYCKLSY